MCALKVVTLPLPELTLVLQLNLSFQTILGILKIEFFAATSTHFDKAVGDA
jgi:hypothetical protein